MQPSLPRARFAARGEIWRWDDLRDPIHEHALVHKVIGVLQYTDADPQSPFVSPYVEFWIKIKEVIRTTGASTRHQEVKK